MLNQGRKLSYQKRLKKTLIQAKTVTDLLFMQEISQLMTLCSKNFQNFDVLPFEVVKGYSQLFESLSKARDAFKEKKAPDSFMISSEKMAEYSVWKLFKESIQEIIDSQTFHGVKLLIPGDRGRVTRQGISYGYDKEGFSSMIADRFADYEKYVENMLKSLQLRFEP